MRLRDWGRLAAIGIAILPLCAAAPGKRSKPGKKKGANITMEIKSSAFSAGEPIPAKFTCSGEDASPPLSWSGVPKGAKSLAIIMDDPDAPPGTWVHWVLYDLPGDLLGLEPGVPKAETLPNGAKHGAAWGVDSFSRADYGGPCPPPGKPHRYFFKLYALDKKLELPPKKTKLELLKAMEGHILDTAQLMGTFKR
jgi:Raf kinase inhibitor-like YbhB/YbcL family protein